MRLIIKIIEVIALIFFISLIFASVFNTPLFFSYVTSGSMEPTIEKYDLIFINVFSRNFQVGDIVVFKSGDQWICHRIVGLISGGYITKGDANIATDQFSGKGVVKKEDIVGKVISINNHPVKISGVGRLLESGSDSLMKNKIYSMSLLIFAGIMLLFEKNIRKRRIKNSIRIRVRSLYVIIAIVTITSFTLFSAMSFERINVDYGTTSAGGLRKEWVSPGELFSRNIEIINKGIYPHFYVIYKISSRATLMSEDSFMLRPDESRIINVEIQAPEDTSLYQETLYVAKYLPVLPLSTIAFLSIKHPYLPILVIDAMLGSVYALGYFMIPQFEVYRLKTGKIKKFIKKLISRYGGMPNE